MKLFNFQAIMQIIGAHLHEDWARQVLRTAIALMASGVYLTSAVTRPPAQVSTSSNNLSAPRNSSISIPPAPAASNPAPAPGAPGAPRNPVIVNPPAPPISNPAPVATPAAPSNPAPVATPVATAPVLPVAPSNPAPVAAPVAAGGGMGTNLATISYWSTGFAFVDAFKGSQGWFSGNNSNSAYAWDDKRPLDLDSGGWVRSLAPNQVARATIFTLPAGSFPSGAYTVLYDGTGTISYRGGATKDNTQSRAGRDIVLIDSNSGRFWIELTQTDPGNYIRNIRILMPGGSCANDSTRWCSTDPAAPAVCGQSACVPFELNYQTRRFHPVFLDSIRNYRVLRFMDWMKTNNSNLTTWSERAKVSDATWSTHKGVPVEIMVDLANQMKAHPWFSIPHGADDTFVSSFATLVKNGGPLSEPLDQSLTTYIEYSNEVWNGAFLQHKYAASQAIALGLAPANSASWEAGPLFYSQRSVQIFNLWSDVFRGTPARFKRVISSQAVSSYLSEKILTYKNAYLSTDALAIAPYFGNEYGGSRAAEVSTWTVDQLLNDLDTSSVPLALRAIQGYTDSGSNRRIPGQKEIAEKYRIDLIAYEGGQHLAGVGANMNNQALTDLFIAANKHPRMKQIYQKYLSGWTSSGGGLFAHYNHVQSWDKFGSWGAAEMYSAFTKTRYPKYEAVQEAAVAKR